MAVMAPRVIVLAALALAACRIHDLDLTGKPCPCPDGWVCDPATSTCARSAMPPGDAADAPGDIAPDVIIVGSYRDAVMADSPIGYWRLGDVNGIAKDEVGMHDGGYSGTCTHSRPGAIAGDSNTAAGFDGSSCEVAITTGFDFPGTTPYTVELWFSVTAMPTIFYHLWSKELRDTSNPIDGYSVVISPTTGVGVELERVVTSNIVKSTSMAVTPMRWTHAVAVYDGTQMIMYVAGNT